MPMTPSGAPLRRIALGAVVTELILRAWFFEFSPAWLTELVSELVLAAAATVLVVLAAWGILRASQWFRSLPAQKHFQSGVLFALLLLPLEILLLGPGTLPPNGRAHALARTADCSQQTGYAVQHLPQGISMSPRDPLKAGPDLGLQIVYVVKAGVRADFKDTQFALRNAETGDTLDSRVVRVEKTGSDDSGYARVLLDELPRTLAGSATEPTVYEVTLQASGKLPKRIDILPPRLIIGGSEYSVEAITFRAFDPQGVYKQCR